MIDKCCNIKLLQRSVKSESVLVEYERRMAMLHAISQCVQIYTQILYIKGNSIKHLIIGRNEDYKSMNIVLENAVISSCLDPLLLYHGTLYRPHRQDQFSRPTPFLDQI